MRKALAQQNNAEISANNDLSLKLLEAQREADAKYAEYAAKNEESKIPYLMALANAANMSSGGGGGGGGGYYRSAKKSSKKSGRKSGSGSNKTSATTKGNNIPGDQSTSRILVNPKTGKETKNRISGMVK